MKNIAELIKSFNAMDIVGARYGECCVVEEYIGHKEVYYTNSKKPRKIHMYKVRCEKCGKVTEKKREQIIKASKRKGIQCDSCSKSKRERIKDTMHTDESRFLAIEGRRLDKTPNDNNISTGIKHYSISRRVRKYKDKEYVRYTHIVACIVDGTTYKIAFKEQKKCEIDLFADIANELNEVFEKGGKEAFYEWYETKVK